MRTELANPIVAQTAPPLTSKPATDYRPNNFGTRDMHGRLERSIDHSLHAAVIF